MDSAFFPDSALAAEVLEPGKVSRKVRARGGRIMLVEVFFSAGGVGAEHDHPHEQASYCVSGEFLFTVAAETRRLLPGDSVFIPASARHGVRCVAEGSLLDAFTPQREDFLKEKP
jgi:quercetin dioxygenase-like cupin family protein